MSPTPTNVLVKTTGVLLLLVALAGLSLSAGASRASAATQGGQIAAFAASQAGVAYCDGGGDIHGPTNGGVVEAGCGQGVKGYDCMSLVQFAVFQATGIALPGDGSQPRGVGALIAPPGHHRRRHREPAAR